MDIIRSTAGRLGAEFPAAPHDCLWLADLAITGDEAAQRTLSHVIGAPIVRLEDEKTAAFEPWAHMADRLGAVPTFVAGALRVLLYSLTGRIEAETLRPMLGRAARALFAHGLAKVETGFTVRAAIGFVIDTYRTDVAASRALLAQLFERDRLDVFGHEEVPAVCYKIEEIGDVDPEFVGDIFRIVFGYEVTKNRQTRIGDSQILSLTSSSQQDYEMARWSLGAYLPKFLEAHPKAAVRAVVNAVEGYVARKYPEFGEALDVELEVGGRLVRLREDRSYVWAHDPDQQYERDAESLISKLRARLRDAPEADAMALLLILFGEASYAVFWSRMFLCAVERGDSLVDHLWPFAATEPFLVLPDTR